MPPMARRGRERRTLLSLVALAALAGSAVAEPGAPPEAARVIAAPAAIATMAARVPGRVDRGDGVLAIVDVGGAGAPWVGVVARRGADLWLRTALGDLRLVGTLARPRLAGPGYLVWAQGARLGDTLRVARLGVLAPPVSPAPASR